MTRTPPRRVLYLHGTSEIGGSDVSLLQIVRHLDRTRYEPLVALPADGPLVAALEQTGAPVLFVPGLLKLTSRRGRGYLLRYAANYPRTVRRVAALARGHRVALIHTNTIHNLYGVAAARLARLPHVWHVREIVWQHGALRRLEVALARASTRVIVTSDAVGAMFTAAGGDWPANVRKIPNGVDTARFHPDNDGSLVRASLGIAPDDPVIGIACRLDTWKGVEIFLQASAIIRARCSRARFVVAGGAIEGLETYDGELKALARTLGVDDVVRFTGWQYRPDDMPRVHAAIDVFVLASTRAEPFGLVLLEAMATGRPVVATDGGGPRDIVVNGETGWLVAPGDPQQMAEAVLRVLDDPAAGRRMGAAGRARVEAHFTQERAVRDIEALYDEVLAG